MTRTPRRRAREFALQGLYQWQLTGADAAEVARNLAELEGYAGADEAFLKAELAGVIGRADELRALLAPLADRKWEEVSPVEKAVLLMGAWELSSLPDLPYRVAINEAIELAKRYGGTDGHRYVNGILDRVAQAARPEEVAAGRTGVKKGAQAGRAARPATTPRKARA
jgi:N utilization substance protein B